MKYRHWSISISQIDNIKINMVALSEAFGFQILNATVYMNDNMMTMIKLYFMKKSKEVYVIHPIETVLHHCDEKDIHPSRIFIIECEPCSA